ncbi:recombinase family protein [Methylobacterium tarhaniae]|uniref:recombinase family protein n=1 Tax=Methylobacterium tarhaniae TaxID=1187852 RepID=UPI000AEADDCB|nr:recombinase family protein [Methylobacterium tarhaniae]
MWRCATILISDKTQLYQRLDGVGRLRARTKAAAAAQAETSIRAVTYARVSTEEQATSGHGLEGQDKALRAFALSQGDELGAVIADPGVSGATRPPAAGAGTRRGSATCSTTRSIAACRNTCLAGRGRSSTCSAPASMRRSSPSAWTKGLPIHDVGCAGAPTILPPSGIGAPCPACARASTTPSTRMAARSPAAAR